ncbi:MAG: polysaccharide biosynthesis protein [Oscillospiraceae bacterium]|nr:polysaccharide biosynthesis protein [Oscillospiraceae bacterium]
MRNIKENRTHSFMGSVAVILMSQIVIKLLGMIYRLVITNIRGFGDAGNGFYNAGFQIYTLLLAISSIGIPNAIAKMVSERAALDDYKGAHKIFRTAFFLFAGIGLVSAAFLFFGADFIARRIIKMDGAQYTLRALAPSIFFVCVSSVIRGYFVGLKNMKATSMSQVLEQFFKSTVTIAIVWLLVGQSPEIMAAGANLATSVATVISFGYLVVFYARRKRGLSENAAKCAGEELSKSTLDMIKSILMISVPISLGSVISAVNRVIDTATITRGIETAVALGLETYKGNTAAEEAVRLAGLLSKSDVLINMPLALNIAFSTVLVPSISGALAVGDREEASDKVSYSFLISILLVLPCAAGYIALAQPIYKLLYPNAQLGASLLQLSAVALIFTALNQTMSGSLQGMGKVFVPATGLFFGCMAKIILNILLIRIPSVNIYGAAISSIVCQVISFVICFRILSRNIDIKIGFKKYILKPAAANILMGAAAFGIYEAVLSLIGSNNIAVCVSILAAVIIYAALVLYMKILSRENILALPAGAKILRLCERLGIY